MNQEFRKFLKKGGRSDAAIKRVGNYLQEFEGYLAEQRGKTLNEVREEDLERFVEWIEEQPKTSAKGHLWGLKYYFEFNSNKTLHQLAGALREQRIIRKPFLIKEFRGVDPEVAKKLAAIGIKHIKHMLEAGKTADQRAVLAEDSGIEEAVILELVKLSDLARIPGIKGIRARLYYDAGIETPQKMAGWDPEEMREHCSAFVERTGFKGIAPLPAEIRFSIAKARKLPAIIEY
jgi:hypothetical protein